MTQVEVCLTVTLHTHARTHTHTYTDQDDHEDRDFEAFSARQNPISMAGEGNRDAVEPRHSRGHVDSIPSGMVSSGLLRRVALVRTTRRNNPEDAILHSHRRENLKSYIAFLPFALVALNAHLAPVM
jgi:hypothetical protein